MSTLDKIIFEHLIKESEHRTLNLDELCFCIEVSGLLRTQLTEAGFYSPIIDPIANGAERVRNAYRKALTWGKDPKGQTKQWWNNGGKTATINAAQNAKKRAVEFGKRELRKVGDWYQNGGGKEKLQQMGHNAVDFTFNKAIPKTANAVHTAYNWFTNPDSKFNNFHDTLYRWRKRWPRDFSESVIGEDDELITKGNRLVSKNKFFPCAIAWRNAPFSLWPGHTHHNLSISSDLFTEFSSQYAVKKTTKFYVDYLKRRIGDNIKRLVVNINYMFAQSNDFDDDSMQLLASAIAKGITKELGFKRVIIKNRKNEETRVFYSGPRTKIGGLTHEIKMGNNSLYCKLLAYRE